MQAKKLQARYQTCNQTSMVEVRGIEPLTSGLSGVRSNQLSYGPFRKVLVYYNHLFNGWSRRIFNF